MGWLFPVIGRILVFLFLGEPGKKRAVPVVSIGWDGADWTILHHLFEKGMPPYLQALVQERG